MFVNDSPVDICGVRSGWTHVIRHGTQEGDETSNPRAFRKEGALHLLKMLGLASEERCG